MAWKHILKYRGPQNESSSGYGIPKFVIEAIMEDNKDQLDSDDWSDYDLITDWFGTPKLEMDVYNGYEIFRNQPNQKKTFLKGYRKQRPFIDQVLTWGMAKISSIILEKKLNEINAQPKMIHRSFLDMADEPPDDFSLDLYFYSIAVGNRLNVVELPVYFKDRLYGEAKGGGGSSIWTRIKIIKRTLKYIIKLSKQKI